MRTTFPLMIAVALTAAAPAAAQGTDNTANADAVAATNDTAATDNAATDSMTTGVANDMTAVAPAEQPIETAEPAPAPAPKSFPWGVLGLLGLVGLIGRKRG